MIGALVRGYWYDAASTLLDPTLDGELSGHSCGSETVTPNKSALLHAHQLAAAARRVLYLDADDFASIATGFQSPYTTYLDRFHSRLGSVNLDTTAISDRPEAGDICPHPCRFVRNLPIEHRRDLDARVRLAMLYVVSPIVALRHHAPVGHFFGVPSTAEISEAWGKTLDQLSRQWRDGCNPLTQASQVGFPDAEVLPGISALVSAVAGRRIMAGRLLRTIGQDVIRALSEGEEAR